MEKRTLGNTDLQVAPLAFGGNVFGWTADEATSFRLLDGFTDAGFNLVDTADVYSVWAPGHKGGESETILGKWMKQRKNREQVVIATKVGASMDDKRKGLSMRYIKQEVEESLRRLQTDYIDLYQSHYDDPDTPIEETLYAYEQLLKAGKVRAIGASNFSAKRLEQSLKLSRDQHLPRYQTYQPLYNLYDRAAFENEYEDICDDYGLGIISYSSLASGFLTGKYRTEQDLDKSPRGKSVKKYLDKRGMGILKALDEVAAEYNSSPASVSLAWLMSRQCMTAPIASATNTGQLQALLAAASLQLSNPAIEKLNLASATE